MYCKVFIALTLYLTLVNSRHLTDFQDEKSVITRKRHDISDEYGSIARACVENNCDEKPKLMPPKLPKLTEFVADEGFLRPPTPYQVNHYANKGTLGVGVGYHGGVLYTHAHPDLLAASHPFNPVERLPAVYTTRVLEKLSSPGNGVPYLDRRTSYGSPRAARLARTDEEEELLDELIHDSMMPNIIPTMSIPMARANVKQNLHANGQVAAVFPGYPNSCSIPILLSCSPSIAQGTFGRPVLETRYKENKKDTTLMKFDKSKENIVKEPLAILPEYAVQ